MKTNTNNYIKILSIFLLLLCGACMGNMDKGGYFSWVHNYDNGIHIKKSVAPYEFDLLYLTPEYRWLQRNENSPRNKEEIYDGLQHYSLTIGFTDPSMDFIEGAAMSGEGLQERLYYFSYRFQDDIYIEGTGEGKKPCVLYHFERLSDLKPNRTFMLGFEDDGGQNESVLVIDSPFLSSVPIKIRVNKDKIPTIEL